MTGFFDYPGSSSAAPGGVAAEECFWVTRADRDWRTLLESCQTLRFPAGHVAYEADATTTSISIITRGRFVEGDRAWIDGQVLGIAPFFSGRPALLDVMAAIDSEVVRLSRDALDVMAAREPELARAVIWELARLLAVTSAR